MIFVTFVIFFFFHLLVRRFSICSCFLTFFLSFLFLSLSLFLSFFFFLSSLGFSTVSFVILFSDTEYLCDTVRPPRPRSLQQYCCESSICRQETHVCVISGRFSQMTFSFITGGSTQWWFYSKISLRHFILTLTIAVMQQ